MINTKIKTKFIIFLIVSLVFIFPLNISLSYAGNGFFDSGAQQKKDIAQTCAPIDVKGSFIFSVLTLCLPGMLEKAKEWQDNKCQLVVCKYEAIINDLDPSFCERQDAYKTCKFIVGEAFALPGLNIIEMIRASIAELLANPVGVLFGVATSLARQTVATVCPVPPPNPVCTSANIWYLTVPLAVVDVTGAIQTIRDLTDSGFSYLDPRPDFCERVPEIKEELEEILATLDAQETLASVGEDDSEGEE